MIDNFDINLIRERLEYEDAFFSQLDEWDDMDFPSDYTVDENGNPEESFDTVIDGDDVLFPDKEEMPLSRNYHEMEVFCYRDEDECWCDEYEPEYDPFDSLDYIPYDF